MFGNLLIVVLSILTLGLILVLFKKIIENELENYNSLPTLEEAQEMVQQQYPNHAHCFTVTKKVTASYSSHWGGTLYSHGQFLECKEIGISIRIKLEEEMS